MVLVGSYGQIFDKYNTKKKKTTVHRVRNIGPDEGVFSNSSKYSHDRAHDREATCAGLRRRRIKDHWR